MSRPVGIQELRAVVREQLPNRPRKATIQSLGPGNATALVKTLETGHRLAVEIPKGNQGQIAVGDTVHLLYFSDAVLAIPMGVDQPLGSTANPLPTVQTTVVDIFNRCGDKDIGQGGSGGLFYLSLIDCEGGPEESLLGGFTTEYDTVHVVQGAHSVQTTSSIVGAGIARTGTFNMAEDGRFTDDSFIRVYVYAETACTVYVQFYDGSVLATHSWAASPGFNCLLAQRSDLTGFPDWSEILSISVTTAGGVEEGLRWIDDLQIVAADPYHCGRPNPTGGMWQPTGEAGSNSWGIYRDVPGVDYALGQVDGDGSTFMGSILAGKTYNVIGHAAVGLRLLAEGETGLIYNYLDENRGYRVVLHPSSNTISLRKVVNGAAIPVASNDFPVSLNTNYYLGVERVGSNLYVYADQNETEVFKAGSLRIVIPETTYTQGGKIGVFCNAPARFFNVGGGSPEFSLTAQRSVNALRLGGLSSAVFMARRLSKV